MTAILSDKGLPVSDANAELTWDDLLNPHAGEKDFNPALHPRDAEGRFTDKPGVLDVVYRMDPLKGHAEPRELPVFDITPEAQDIIYRRLENVGITHVALADEISTRVRAGGQGLMDEAEQWYPMAKRTAAEMSRNSNGRIDTDHAEALIAALSPQMEWDQNVDIAQRMTSYVAEGNADDKTPEAAALDFIKRQIAFAEEHGYNKPFLDRRKAVDAMSIAMGEGIDEHLNGLKVRSFFNNINDPGGTRDVTIDTHMVKVMRAVSPGLVKDQKFGGTDASALGLLNANSAKEGQQYGGAGYVAISEAVRAVADELGVSPDTIQAAYWIAVRDTDYEDIRPAGEET